MFSIVSILRALEHPDGLFRTLLNVELMTGSAGNPIYATGNSSVVFKIRCSLGVKSLKCYMRPKQNLPQIYGDNFLAKELFLANDFAHGEGHWCDVVVSDWIEGETLEKRIITACANNDKAALSELATRFDLLGCYLLDQRWAHGDIKPENIIVGKHNQLSLIDFDSKFLPQFRGKQSAELGTPAYQYHGRNSNDFNRHIDDYSIANISTTLHALATDPTLFGKYADKDHTLLNSATIHTEPQHLIISNLFEQNGMAREFQIAQLLKYNYCHLPSLRELLTPSTPVCSLFGEEDFEPFEQNGLWGFRNRQGYTIIPPRYTNLLSFSESKAAVQVGRSWHFIDCCGKTVHNCSDYVSVTSFKDGYATLIATDHTARMDHNGKIV